MHAGVEIKKNKQNLQFFLCEKYVILPKEMSKERERERESYSINIFTFTAYLLQLL
jgi:hypothetical protein